MYATKVGSSILAGAEGQNYRSLNTSFIKGSYFPPESLVVGNKAHTAMDRKKYLLSKYQLSRWT